MRIFLDTNIYLDYFRATTADRLEPLRKLAELVKGNKVTLLLPEQTINEYRRGRRKVAEEKREYLMQSVNSAPNVHLIGKSSRKVRALSKNIAKTKESFKNLIKEHDDEIERERTEADKIIKQLFKKALLLPDNPEVLEKAHRRYLRGNPPRKNDHSYGDAIAWETILANSTSNALTIISNDSDYAEKQKGNKALNSFLKSEWTKASPYPITLFDSLAEFINRFNKKETIKKEVVDREKTYADSVSAAAWRSPITLGGNTLSSLMSVPITTTVNRPIVGYTLTGEKIVLPANAYAGYTISESMIMPPEILYCPYCGTKNPTEEGIALATTVFRTTFLGKTCKVCGKNININ